MGEGVLLIYCPEISKLYVIHLDLIWTDVERIKLLNYKPLPIFTELGLNSNKPIREQEPNPLPDRKALDDIVFDAFELTEDERREVYWAVAELVKRRLDKAKSM